MKKHGFTRKIPATTTGKMGGFTGKVPDSYNCEEGKIHREVKKHGFTGMIATTVKKQRFTG